MRLLAIAGLLVVMAGACGPVTYWPKQDHPSGSAWRPPPEQPHRPQRKPADSRRGRRWRTVGNAAAVGFVLGAFLGSTACDDLHETDRECEDRTLDSALIGGAIGAAVGVAIAP